LIVPCPPRILLDCDHADQHRNCSRCQPERRPPRKPTLPTLFPRNPFQHLRPKRWICRKSLSRRMDRPLPLHPPQTLSRALGATAQMRVKLRRLLRRKFAVKICVEFCGPFLMDHFPPRCSFPFTASRGAFRALDSRAITVPAGIESVVAISAYDISSTSHNNKTSRYGTGSPSIADCMICSLALSIRIVSGVSVSTGSDVS